MTERLVVAKTHKLFINGQFPRSESGRSIAVQASDGRVLAHICHASRKDLRDAVLAARGAHEGWLRRSAYNRGQILYRMAEMMEGKRDEFVGLVREGLDASARPKSKNRRRPIPGGSSAAAAREVAAAIDRLIAFAGWADKFSQVLGCHNMVNGPYYNFSVAEGTGVATIVAPDEPSLLGLVSLVAPALAGGATVVALGSPTNPLPTCVLGEVAATSDVPPGVLNLLTGDRAELVPHVAEHREIDAVVAANLPADQGERLRLGAANNVKRVLTRTLTDAQWYDEALCESPWWIEPTVEIKTIWHPSAA